MICQFNTGNHEMPISTLYCHVYASRMQIYTELRDIYRNVCLEEGSCNFQITNAIYLLQPQTPCKSLKSQYKSTTNIINPLFFTIFFILFWTKIYQELPSLFPTYLNRLLNRMQIHFPSYSLEKQNKTHTLCSVV